MSETCPKPTDQWIANLTALRRQLLEMALKHNCSSRDSKRPDHVDGPVPVIRGK